MLVVIDARTGELVSRYATRTDARARADEVGAYYAGFGKNRRRVAYARVAKVTIV